MSADDIIAAQLLGNGGKIEPYTIIIMLGVFWILGHYTVLHFGHLMSSAN
jgi:hypothetical protein